MKPVRLNSAIDYRKLLKMRIDAWGEAEGVGWNFERDNSLTNEEKTAVEGIEKELEDEFRLSHLKG